MQSVDQLSDGNAADPLTASTGDVAGRRLVLFLNHTATLGGGEIALFHLVTQLDHRRYRPVVLLFTHGPLVGRLREAGIETRVMRAGGAVVNARKDALGGRSLLKLGTLVSAMAFCGELCRVMRADRYAIVHTNSLKSDILGGVAGRLARQRVVWHVRDRIADDYLPPGVARAFRLMCRVLPTRIIANSHATRQTIATDGRSALARRTRVVHDGTTNGAAPAMAPVERAATGPLVAIVGRITPWKGQDVFLHATALVLMRFPTARFQVIGAAMFGEDEFERSVHRLATDLKIAHAVEFTGFRSDVSDLIRKVDVLVHASVTGEPFGQVVIEGMAAGKPVVATNGGGIPEIVVDGQTGLLVPMNDAPAMAGAICQLLADPTKAAAMGQAGYRRVNERFLVKHVAQNVMRVYDEMLS